MRKFETEKSPPEFSSKLESFAVSLSLSSTPVQLHFIAHSSKYGISIYTSTTISLESDL